MNQKKAKSIRRTMKRMFGRDAREVVTVPKKPMMRVIPNFLNPKAPHVAEWTGQHALEPTCGRSQYQGMKRHYKAARQQGENLLGPAASYR